jgi:hypothetical protein
VLFNVLEASNAPQWQALKGQFSAECTDLQAATRQLIDASFKKVCGSRTHV